MTRRIVCRSLLWGGIMSALLISQAKAVEHGTGIYLLGSKGPLAGQVPAPGVYIQNDLIIEHAKAGISTALPLGGQIGAGINARALIYVPTVLWVPANTWLGGSPAFSVSQPFGRESLHVDIVTTPQSERLNNTHTALGDPIASAMLGWHSTSFYWSTTAMVNIPLGQYEKNAATNIAFHHWATDLAVAGSWLPPNTGWEISGTSGMTLNARNPATQYQSGQEFHLEAAISKSVSPPFSLGLIGYHYRQISDDTGKGAILGGFRGQASALGPTANYIFMAQNTPISVRFKLLHEFKVKNRLKSTTGFLTVSLPLHN